MELSERIKELERIIAYRENNVPDHENDPIPGWMYLKQIKEYLSDLKEAQTNQSRLLAVARAAKEFHDNVLGWSTISINGKKLAIVDDELAEALAAVEDLL